jgi:hypothetical protein
MTPLPPWSQVVHLQSDVESGQTATSVYAIDLGALVANDPHVPQLYRQARDFFSATHLTSGLHRLLQDVLGGLSGAPGDRVLQLRSPFGGGKSHTLAALYHAAKDRAALNTLPESAALPDPGQVRIAVFDGEKFDVTGRVINGQHAQTLWGNLAAQLGCYDLVSYHDQNRISPGGDVIAQMLGKGSENPQPILILLDEVLKYLERVLAVPVADSTMGRQTQEFLQSLSVEVAGTSHSVMIYSLQASVGEAYGNESLLDMLDHLTARVDAKREPVSGDEILPVLRRRLLAETPDPAVAIAVAEAMASEITRMKSAQALDDAARRDAENDRLALRDRFVAAYPFHPALIDIMRERWASLPHFQRTRGALRFLAICLHTLKHEDKAGLLLGPGDIPIQNGDVNQAFFTEVGQREPFQAVLTRDFLGANARVHRIDDKLAEQNPKLSNANPALHVATAILCYSFGGLSRRGEDGDEPIATGVSESELLSAVVGPDLDSITSQVVVKELREQCLYVHFDGARYVFKTTPNITLTLEEEAEHVKRDEIDQAIREELENRLRGRSGVILWPSDSQNIPDREPRFVLAYLPLDFAQESNANQESQASQHFKSHGDHARHFRNGLGLAVPERNQIGSLRRAMKYLKAIQRVREKRHALNLTAAQVHQLVERENTEKTALESAIRNLYQSVWLPTSIEGEQVTIEKVTLAGRPLQSQGIHERLVELLAIPPKRVFNAVTPEKILELMRLGSGPDTLLGVNLAQVVECFYRILSFPRLESEAVLRRAIVRGVQEGVFGYIGRAAQVDVSQLREGSGYMIDHSLVRVGVPLLEDEIDMSSALIVLPNVIAPEHPPEPVTSPLTPAEPGSFLPVSPEPGVTPSQPSIQPESARTHVRLSMRLSRQQLYACWDAFKNLAESAGSIRILVEAVKYDGFDPTWLHNAVLEPLDEADVEVHEE